VAHGASANSPAFMAAEKFRVAIKLADQLLLESRWKTPSGIPC
jgi:hypothetical protein